MSDDVMSDDVQILLEEVLRTLAQNSKSPAIAAQACFAALLFCLKHLTPQQCELLLADFDKAARSRLAGLLREQGHPVSGDAVSMN